MVARLLLLAAATSVSALIPAPFGGVSQRPLGGGDAASDFKCDLPPALDPASDGLPSADELFTSQDALLRQVKRHQAIVRVPSICYDDLGSFDEDKRWAPFYDLHAVLEKTYPTIHERMTVEKINTFGLVYTVKGSDSSLKPVLLAAHQDVVPVADPSTWTHPPFDAYFDGEWLWGRGASDDKNSLTALMSALETLLYLDWQPKRTWVLAFGFDEECSGYRGAGTIGDFLTERYGDGGFAMILDEGGLGLQQYNDTLYALPAVMEKGHVDIWMELHVVGGHSSIPFPHTGIGIVSEIVTTLESHPYEPRLLKGSPPYNHLVCLARHSPNAAPGIGHLLKKGDLKALTKEIVKDSRMARFMIQTSQAVDVFQAGVKINAMPEVVTLGVNYRVAPQDSIPKVQYNVVKYIHSIVKKYDLTLEAYKGDEEYEKYLEEVAPEDLTLLSRNKGDKGTLVIEAKEKFPVTPTAPTKGAVWDTFSGTVQHTLAYDNGKVVPVGLIMTGNTDTRHYLNLSPNIYRWSPSRERGADNIHTIDEKIRMKSHMEIVRIYYDLIRNFDVAEV